MNFLGIEALKEFKAEIKKQLYLRDWQHKDLAAAIGYSTASIDSFMCGTRFNRKIAKAIGEKLGIDYNKVIT